MSARNVLILKKLTLAAVILMVMSAPAYALPLMVQFTIDELFRGVAVLFGDIDESTLAVAGPNERAWQQELQGTNWNVNVNLSEITVTPEGGGTFIKYNFWADAFHKTAPHAGETKPGLTIGGFGDVLLNNLGGLDPSFFGASNQDSSDSLIHPGGDHYDSIRLHADDLNGAGAGFLSRDNQVSIRMNLAHSPEPSSFLLLGIGLTYLLRSRKR